MEPEGYWPPRSPDFDALSDRSQHMRMFSALRSLLSRQPRLLPSSPRVRPFGELFRAYALYFADRWGSPLPAIVPFPSAEASPDLADRLDRTMYDLYRSCSHVMLHTRLRDAENQRELIWQLAAMAALLGCPVYGALHEDHAHAVAWASRGHPRLGAAATEPLSSELAELIWGMVPAVHYRYEPPLAPPT